VTAHLDEELSQLRVNLPDPRTTSCSDPPIIEGGIPNDVMTRALGAITAVNKPCASDELFDSPAYVCILNVFFLQELLQALAQPL